MEIELSADYNEQHNKEAKNAIAGQTVTGLDLTNTMLKVAVPNIDQYSNEEYALLRRHGFGASDSSIILGVNPYKTRDELIQEKISKTLSEEEKAVGEKVAVRKGRDLEALIIRKFEKYFGQECIKPKDMYMHKDYPFITINFDGVTGTPKQYIPAEIKVVTMYGEKHYDFSKAMYYEQIDRFLPLPEDVSDRNWSIENKAAHYGIPPYYYTQLQQQMLGLNAPFGYLSVLADRDWYMRTFFVYRDNKIINQLIVEAYKLWQIIESKGGTTFENMKKEGSV
jgi:hypothetical protein